MPIVRRAQSTLASAPSLFNVRPQSMNKWLKARAKVRASTGRAKIICWGDSTTAGAGAGASGTTNMVGAAAANYPVALTNLLTASGLPASYRSLIGDSGCTAASGITLDTFDPRCVFGATWASSATFSGAGGRLIRFVNGSVNSFAFTPSGSIDTITVYYFRNSGLGDFKVNVDGGASLGTTSTNGAAAILSVTHTVAAGQHTINIEGQNNGTVYILGIYSYLSTTAAVDVLHGAQYGGVVSNMTDASQVYSWFNAMDTITADLYAVCMTINDEAAATSANTWASSMGSVVSKLSTYGSVLIVIGAPRNGVSETLLSAYIDAAKGLATTYNCGVADLRDRWTNRTAWNAMGFDYGDGIHPNAPGYCDKAQMIANAILSV